MEHVDEGKGDVAASETGKAGRNKLSCSIACLDDTKFHVNIEVKTEVWDDFSLLVVRLFVTHSVHF